ncbi:hypothetical protein NUW58_g3938 [Xylaria curta]|uniref:Uncharacterized protein n=1 Tax=Xylaria curta TaxID=42375 RepID=A0ACC1PBN0_9PEZI|nr:hypothetical protein NUW58_g3938 [Xylaria curta]
MGLQLERLEQSMEQMQKSLNQLLMDKPIHSSPLSWTQAALSSHDKELPPPTGLHEILGPGLGRRGFRSVAGSETLAGPMTLHSFTLDAKELLLETAVCTGRLSQCEAPSLADRLDTLLTTHRSNPQVETHHELPTMPPMAMLEPMIEPYFDQVNPTFPIWTREGFRSKISQQQQGDVSYVVSANNIILLTLTAKFVRAMSRKTFDESNEQTFSSMELELVRPFVMNARRATEQMNLLSSPTLSNTQALLSLCLVAQYYLPEGSLYKLYHQAVYISRSIGLDSPDALSSSTNNDYGVHLQERRNVFRCLCILGPSVSWATGILAVNLMSDWTPFAALPEENSTNTWGLDWKSRIHLAQIEERAFHHLATHAAENQSQPEVESVAEMLLADLEEWRRRSRGQELGDGRLVMVRPSETAINSYHFLRLMLLLAIENGSESNERTLNASRALMRAFVDAWRAGSDLAHYTILARHVSFFTPAAMMQVIAAQRGSNATASDFDEDLALLGSFRSMVRTVAGLSHADSYAMHQTALIDILYDLASSSTKSSPGTDIHENSDTLFEAFSDSVSDATKTLEDTTDQSEETNNAAVLQKSTAPAFHGNLPFTGHGQADTGQFDNHYLNDYQELMDNIWWNPACL